MGKTPSRNNTEYWNTKDFKWISIADLTKAHGYISETKEYISERAVSESGIKIIPANTVVMSFKLSIGKTAITSEDMYSNEAIMAFHDKHVVEILPEYIFYIFKYKKWDEDSNNAVMGKTLNKAILSEVEIEICSIEKQRAIVDILDNMMSVLESRGTELDLLDNLIKARFVELFYDKGYPVLKWNDVFVTTTGKLDSNAAVENGEYPFFTCSKKMLKIDHFAFDQEALLLSGNNAAGKYDVKYYKGKFNAYQRTYILGLKDDWSYQLFRYQLESKLVYLQQQSLGGLTKYLTMKILEKLEFVIPPIEKQLEFETFVYQVDKSKLLSFIKLLEQLITYLYNVFIIYRQDKGEEVERYE